MKRNIFPYDFTPYYPMGIQPCPMYVDVANKIYSRIKDISLDKPDADYLKKQIAINIAIYFEDKMSGIGLWNAFTTKHFQMYGRQLPFYDDYDYLSPDDVNKVEVELLIWFVLSREHHDRFLNPLALGEDTANAIMEVLGTYDEVEVNDGLYDYIYNPIKADDYFKLKHILIWLRRSYLLCSPLSDDRMDKLKYEYSQQFTKSEAIYYAETTFAMTTEIGPLALPAHLWLAEMYSAGEMLGEADKLTSLRYHEQDVFEVTNAGTEYATLRDSSGEEYTTKNTFRDVFKKDAYVSTALVKYGEQPWEMNGVVIQSSENAYDHICQHSQSLKQSYEEVYPTYMKRTGGKRLAFFENKRQLSGWLQKVMPEVDINELNNTLPDTSITCFISKKAGIIFAPSIIHAIKSDDNPYYKQCDKQTLLTETMNALLNIEAMHPELLNYLLENQMLQDGDIPNKTPMPLGNQIFTLNIDFIARNHRRHLYHDHDY